MFGDGKMVIWESFKNLDLGGSKPQRFGHVIEDHLHDIMGVIEISLYNIHM